VVKRVSIKTLHLEFFGLQDKEGIQAFTDSEK